MYNFLETYHILYQFQFGFRKGYSTKLATVDILEKIRMALDSGSSVLGIYIDLTKSCDTGDHNILISKLFHYGIRGTALNWLKLVK